MPKRQVSQFNPDTGEFMQTFEGIVDATQQTGIHGQSIRNAALGKQYYAGGYIWSFENPDTFTPPTRQQVERKKFENRSRANTGREVSQETREKMSKARIGKKLSQERRDKLRKTRSRPVFAYDSTTGAFKGWYESTMQAFRETGINQASIYRAAAGQRGAKVAGQYIWSFEPLSQDDINNRVQAYKTARAGRGFPRFVYQYAAVDLELVTRYPSMNMAAKGMQCSIHQVQKAFSSKRPDTATVNGYYLSDHILNAEEKKALRLLLGGYALSAAKKKALRLLLVAKTEKQKRVARGMSSVAQGMCGICGQNKIYAQAFCQACYEQYQKATQ